MKNGIEINLADIFHRLLKKWKLLAILVLAGAVALNFYGYRSAGKSAESEQRQLEKYIAEYEASEAELPEYFTPELAHLRSQLTDEEALFVEATARIYVYRLSLSETILSDLIPGEESGKDLELIQTMYYVNEDITSATALMDAAQKSYYNVLIKAMQGNAGNYFSSVSSPGIIQPKWILLGAVAGAAAAFCIVALPYVLSKKLRKAEDMERAYSVPVIFSGKAAALDAPLVSGALMKLLSERKSVSLLCANSEDAETVSKELAALLEKSGLKCGVCNVSAGDAELLSAVSKADTAICIDKLGVSKYADIEKRIAVCRNLSVPVPGCIVIE